MNSPDDFFREYERLFGCKPPQEFIRAYSVLCEALYWGISREDQADRPPLKKGKNPGEHWPLHEWQLLPVKTEVDKALAQIARALQRYRRARETQGGPPPQAGG